METSIMYQVIIHKFRKYYFPESEKSVAIDFASYWGADLKAIFVQCEYNVNELGIGA